MAKAKYGAFITEIKGHVGGTTFQASRGGFTVKNKGRRGTDGTTGQASGIALRKNNFSAITKMWGTLTAAQRLGWNNLIGIWTFINKFGDVYNGTGYQIFTAANLNLIELSESTIGDDPAVNNAFDPTITYDDFSLAGTFNGRVGNAAAIGQIVATYLSKPTYASRPVAKVPIPKFAPYVITGTGDVNYKAAVLAIWGFIPQLGDVFYIKTWSCWADYPKKQYLQIHKITVVA